MSARFFLSTFGYLFGSSEETSVLLRGLPPVFLLSLVLPGASSRSPAARSVTLTRHLLRTTFYSRGIPHEPMNSAAPLQFRILFTKLGKSQLCCSSVLDTSFFVARRFFFFFSLCPKKISSFPFSDCPPFCLLLRQPILPNLDPLSSYWSPPHTVSSVAMPDQTVFPFIPPLAIRRAVSLLQNLQSGLLSGPPL